MELMKSLNSNYNDQARLLDVLEEGIIPLNKHGTHMIIQSPTTIIATANPTQSTWNDSQKVSNDENSNAANFVRQIQSDIPVQR